MIFATCYQCSSDSDTQVECSLCGRPTVISQGSAASRYPRSQPQAGAVPVTVSSQCSGKTVASQQLQHTDARVRTNCACVTALRHVLRVCLCVCGAQVRMGHHGGLGGGGVLSPGARVCAYARGACVRARACARVRHACTRTHAQYLNTYSL